MTDYKILSSHSRVVETMEVKVWLPPDAEQQKQYNTHLWQPQILIVRFEQVDSGPWMIHKAVSRGPVVLKSGKLGQRIVDHDHLIRGYTLDRIINDQAKTYGPGVDARPTVFALPEYVHRIIIAIWPEV